MKLNFRRPLILMTPKSLLRHPRVVSPLSELTEGGFQEVLGDSCEPDKIGRILLCSGKIFYDLVAQREASGRMDTALIRMEQLYPFPDTALRTCLEKYPSVREVTWVQEEPRNYGAWAYMHEHFPLYFPQISLHYFGRDQSASSETGSFKQYQAEQKKLVEDAFNVAPTSKAASE